MVARHPEDAPTGLLIADRRVTGTYAEIGGREHHGHRRLAEIVLIDGDIPLAVGLGQDHDDRGRCGRFAGP